MCFVHTENVRYTTEHNPACIKKYAHKARPHLATYVCMAHGCKAVNSYKPSNVSVITKMIHAGTVSAWVSYALGQIPKSVPMQQVRQFLTTQVSPLPCSMDVSSRLALSSAQWEGRVEVTGLYLDGLFGAIIAEVSQGFLVAPACVMGCTLCDLRKFELQGFNMTGSEEMTIVGTEVCIGHVLELLRVNAPRGPLSLRLDHDRDSIVSDTCSASSAYGCRPNSYYIVNDRLLLVGEDKVNSEEVLLACWNVVKVTYHVMALLWRNLSGCIKCQNRDLAASMN